MENLDSITPQNLVEEIQKNLQKYITKALNEFREEDAKTIKKEIEKASKDLTKMFLKATATRLGMVAELQAMESLEGFKEILSVVPAKDLLKKIIQKIEEEDL